MTDTTHTATLLSIHISRGPGRSHYARVAPLRIVESEMSADIEEQAWQIAECVGRQLSMDVTVDEIEIRDGGLGKEHLCVILARFGSDRPHQTVLMTIPATVGLRQGRVMISPAFRSPPPWTIEPDGAPSIDWESIERRTRREDDELRATHQGLGPMPEDRLEVLPSLKTLQDLLDAGPGPVREADEEIAPVVLAAESAAEPSKILPTVSAVAKSEIESTMATTNGIPVLPPVRKVSFAGDVPSARVMEDRPLAGSDLLDWNMQGHVVRQYQVLAEPLPLLGGPMMQMGDGEPEISRMLLARFPWMKDAVDAVTRSCHMQAAAGHAWFRMPPTMLIGPPGSGKTNFVRTLARLAGLGWTLLDCASSHDSVTISGTPRGYTTTMPNFAAVVMEATSTANPVLHLDEIEKASRSQNGYIPDAVLSMTEPTSATCYYDQCLQRKIDVSLCSWIATANDHGNLTGPFLNRFGVIQVPAARGEHVEAVVRGITEEIAGEWNLSPADLPRLSEASLDLLRVQLDHGSLRTVSKTLRTLWSRDIMEHGRPSLH